MSRSLNVTRPFLPPIEEYKKMIDAIYQRHWLTNHGPLVIELEQKLSDYLHIENLQYVTNGTIALQLAIKCLKLKGEVITTPFSYVATTSSLVWEHCKPVFADIDPKTFNIDPYKIEELITEKTTGIVATHVFGNACEVEEIERIAKKNNLKVIYDAAHAFGVRYKNHSLLDYGDISTLSFHATKMFHTIEGGAVVSSSHELHRKLLFLKNFGHDGYEAFSGVGINGKNSEFHAAMGLCNLEYIDEIRRKYKTIYERYIENLKDLPGLNFQSINPECTYNCAYFPLLFSSEKLLLKVKSILEESEIFPRRYFYPSLSTLEYVDSFQVPVSDSISKTILCLPLFYDLIIEDVDRISEIIKKSI